MHSLTRMRGAIRQRIYPPAAGSSVAQHVRARVIRGPWRRGGCWTSRWVPRSAPPPPRGLFRPRPNTAQPQRCRRPRRDRAQHVTPSGSALGPLHTGPRAMPNATSHALQRRGRLCPHLHRPTMVLLTIPMRVLLPIHAPWSPSRALALAHISFGFARNRRRRDDEFLDHQLPHLRR